MFGRMEPPTINKKPPSLSGGLFIISSINSCTHMPRLRTRRDNPDCNRF